MLLFGTNPPCIGRAAPSEPIIALGPLGNRLTYQNALRVGPGLSPFGRRFLCALPRRLGRERSYATDAVVVAESGPFSRRRPSAGANVDENRRGRLAGEC